jgi:hypothetical protein
MMLYLWFAVMMQTFLPGGDRIASMQTGALEARFQAEIQQSALVGAAGHIARYTPLAARAR